MLSHAARAVFQPHRWQLNSFWLPYGGQETGVREHLSLTTFLSNWAAPSEFYSKNPYDVCLKGYGAMNGTYGACIQWTILEHKPTSLKSNEFLGSRTSWQTCLALLWET